MASSITRGLALGAALFGGLQAGVTANRAFVLLPAWERLGVFPWANFTRAGRTAIPGCPSRLWHRRVSALSLLALFNFELSPLTFTFRSAGRRALLRLRSQSILSFLLEDSDANRYGREVV